MPNSTHTQITNYPAVETFDWAELAKDRLWITMTIDCRVIDDPTERSLILADLTRSLAVLLAEHANDPDETAALKSALAAVDGNA